MGALASDKALSELDGTDSVDYRRTSRPFSHNCGFTLGESAQFVILMNDARALELGAQVYGAVGDVFVNADGFKKSIASPGVGNYITFAKAAKSLERAIGKDALQQNTFVQAHGTSTPLNRTSESIIFDETAKHFGIENWPVAAIKAYVGHSLMSAAGDQLINTLGVFNQGIVPGIHTIDEVAPDVSRDCLSFSKAHQSYDANHFKGALLNAKGFGGNNASASILAPAAAEKCLADKCTKSELSIYLNRREASQEKAHAYAESVQQAPAELMYHFNHNVLADDAVSFEGDVLRVGDFEVKL
jgi:acetoacetyl-[acyl-carrier protein] synthase